MSFNINKLTELLHKHTLPYLKLIWDIVTPFPRSSLLLNLKSFLCMNIYLFSFGTIDVKVSVISKKTIPNRGGSFSFSFADEKPLSEEQQSQLRSKYLLEDDDEEKKPIKRNMLRSQSLITSKNLPEKSFRKSFENNEKNTLTSKTFILKNGQKAQEATGQIIESRRCRVSDNLPPKVPMLPAAKKETNCSKGIY